MTHYAVADISVTGTDTYTYTERVCSGGSAIEFETASASIRL
jgi:hypothetical protein